MFIIFNSAQDIAPFPDSIRRRDNRLRHRLYVTDYTHQQVIGLGHHIQAFIQMPLIFMTEDAIWAARWPRIVRPPSSWRMDTVKFYGLFPNHAPPHGGFTLSCTHDRKYITLYVHEFLLRLHQHCFLDKKAPRTTLRPASEHKVETLFYVSQFL